MQDISMLEGLLVEELQLIKTNVLKNRRRNNGLAKAIVNLVLNF